LRWRRWLKGRRRRTTDWEEQVRRCRQLPGRQKYKNGTLPTPRLASYVETWHQAVLGLVVRAPDVLHVFHLLLLAATAGAARWAGAAGGARRRPGRVPFGGRTRYGGREGQDRSAVRKQREVDGAESGDGSLTGSLQSALEAGESECARKAVRVHTYTCNDTCIALSERVQRHL
jgi:hypothetical protein